jgi:hypothetical protein
VDFGLGAKNGATVFAAEYGDGLLNKTVLTLTNTPMTLEDTAEGGTVKIYDFPLGHLAFQGAYGTLTFTTTSILANTLNASSTLAWGVGTVLYDNTATDGTLHATEANIIASTAATSSATINVVNTATTGVGATQATINGATALDANLNVSVPTDTDIDADATLLEGGADGFGRVGVSAVGEGDQGVAQQAAAFGPQNRSAFEPPQEGIRLRCVVKP